MTIDALSCDDDLWVRGLRGLPAPITPSMANGLSPASSIAKSSAAEPASPSRPELEPPKHWMYSRLNTHSELERIADKQTHLLDSQVKQQTAEIEQIEKEKAEKLRKSAEAMQSQHTWSVLSNVAQYLMSGSTIMLGAAVLPAAPLAGGCLILSGITGLGGRVMHDMGAYPAIAAWLTQSEELQKKIATRLEMGTLFLSFGLGLGGGAWAHSMGALATADKAQKIIAGVALGAGIGKGVAEIKGSLLKKRSTHLEADIQEMQVRIDQLYQDMYQDAREAQNLIDTAGEIGDQLKQEISGLHD
jgi:hypothetical protein